MYCPCWYIKLHYIFSSVKYQVAGEDYLVAPISSHQILQWCPKWDSNPQNPDFESGKYTSSIIRAYALGCCAPPQRPHWQVFSLQYKNLAKTLLFDWLLVCGQSTPSNESALSPKTFSLILVLKSSWAGFFAKLWNAPLWDYCNYK